jgi:hypothetical protein
MERYGLWSKTIRCQAVYIFPRKSNNAPFQVDFLKSGRPIFSGNRGQKERLIRRASCAVVCASRGRGDPDGREAFGGHKRPTRLRLALQVQPNSPCEEGCVVATTSKMRRVMRRCGLTARDCRRHSSEYSAPVSGIGAPQCVSNVRLVTEL